jgi:hypothetical protein
MRSAPCAREAFCPKAETDGCPLKGGLAAAVNFIHDDETYVRMVHETHWVDGKVGKAALTLDMIAEGASGNRVEMLTAEKYADVVAARTGTAGFFTVSVKKVRELRSDSTPDAGFLFCPLQSGVHPETHADLRFRTKFTGKKPPQSWRSLRDQLFLACQSHSTPAGIFAS